MASTVALFLLFSHSSRFLCTDIFKHFLTQILMSGKKVKDLCFLIILFPVSYCCLFPLSPTLHHILFILTFIYPYMASKTSLNLPVEI